MSDEKKRKRTRNGKKWGKMNDKEEGIYRRRRKENEVAVWGKEKKMKEKK